ncbi:flavin reductase family protein [Nonomuraea sp. NPDC046570]|uniref:flavin reductase family protein n=1 Tax=Nonomuraea sp. NPDC046570 TaxID=3155255 RepID=UPI0033E85323
MKRLSLVAPEQFRAALGTYTTGVAAVTAFDEETRRPYGIAVNSFTSVSLCPPLVAFCVAHTSTTWPHIRHLGAICVNILAEGQEVVCRELAFPGEDKFRNLSWSLSPGGGPLLHGTLAWLDCVIQREYLAGDHTIVVAEVHDLEHREEALPLVFFRGAFGLPA